MIWKPDTCNCEIEVNREWTVGSAIKKCSIHENVADENIFTTVLTECRNKNFSLGEIEEKLKTLDSSLFETYANEKGETVQRFKKEYKPDWAYDENRNVIITMKGVKENDLRALKALVSKYNTTVNG